MSAVPRSRLGIACVLGATLLAASPASAARNTITAPPRVDAVLDARLDDTRPIDLTVTHDLFLTPITERLDALAEIRLERYLWTVVPMGKRIIYPDEELRPIAATELSDAQYRTWDRASPKQAATFLDTIATQTFRSILPKHWRNRRIPWRTGYADRFAQALDRATPYIPYLEEMAAARGLPRDTWLLAVQESLFRPAAVSKAWCEGPFQLSRPAARSFGLIVPRSATGGNATQVNESLHPLLAAQAAFDLLIAYAHHTGGFLTGVSAYHAGPGNLARMRALQLRHPYWRAQESDEIASMVKERYAHGIDAALFDPATETAMPTGDAPAQEDGDADEGETTAAADGLSWIVSDGWRHPGNASAYRRESSLYVPRFIALRNSVRRDAFFTSERELAGTRLVRAGTGSCGPRGPFTTDAPVCWEALPSYRTVERYVHGTADLDLVEVRYRTTQRPGKEPLTGELLARAVGSAEVFVAYNPHIPLKARIPDGTRVALPPGTGSGFADAPSLRGLVAVPSLTAYRAGTATPRQARPEPLPEDRAYARLALLRSDGRFAEVLPEAVCAIADRMESLDDGSWYRAQQRRASRMDCALTSHASSRALIELADQRR